MGSYVIYTQDGRGTITIQTGDDDYFNVGKGEFLDDLQSLGGLSEVKVTTAMNSINDITSEATTVVGVMQEQNWNKSVLELDRNALSKQQNAYLENQQKILKATAESNIRNTQAIRESNSVTHSLLGSLLKSIEELTSVLYEKENITSVTNKIDTSSFSQAIDKMTEATEKMNSTISEGVKSQVSVDKKTLEKLDIELNPDIYYDGSYYNKVEVQKMESLEKYKESKDGNDFSLTDALFELDDFLEDGFSLDVNPLRALTSQLQLDLMKEYNDMNIKYNLKMGSL